MKDCLIKTADKITPLLLRLTLGAVSFPHGAQKVFGWFGGHGYSATMKMFTENMHIPAPAAFLAILAEFGGAIALLFGLLTRAAAAGIASVMVVAILTVQYRNGFFMNWSGAQAGEGFEYHLLALAIAVALIIEGGGKWSVDRALSRVDQPENPNTIGA